MSARSSEQSEARFHDDHHPHEDEEENLTSEWGQA